VWVEILGMDPTNLHNYTRCICAVKLVHRAPSVLLAGTVTFKKAKALTFQIQEPCKQTLIKYKGSNSIKEK
jgi:hypothetical protein